MRSHLFVETVLGLVVKDKEPRLGVEAGVVVARFDERCDVEGVLHGLHGPVPNADRVPVGALPVRVLGHDGGEDLALVQVVVGGHVVRDHAIPLLNFHAWMSTKGQKKRGKRKKEKMEMKKIEFSEDRLSR